MRSSLPRGREGRAAWYLCLRMATFFRSKAILSILLLLALTFLTPIFFSPASRDDEANVDADKVFFADVNTSDYLEFLLETSESRHYGDGSKNSTVSRSSFDDNLERDSGDVSGLKTDFKNGQNDVSVQSVGQGQPNQMGRLRSNGPSQPEKINNDRIRMIKDQLLTARAYLSSLHPHQHYNLISELHKQMKDLQDVVGEAKSDSDLPKRALESMKSLEVVFSEAGSVLSKCSALELMLCSNVSDVEVRILEERKQISFLAQIAESALPKDLHCLFMRLTDEYFAQQQEQREFLNKHIFQHKGLYHYAIFSDNVIACAVVVNSTVSTSMVPEKIVFHILTDDLHFSAISMWFLANPPGQAEIQVQRIDDLTFMPSNISLLEQIVSKKPNLFPNVKHVYFYLPEIFPMLDKIVLLDQDMVVQRDLQDLWDVDMKGKVNGVVDIWCVGNSLHLGDEFVHFVDPTATKYIKLKSCSWVFGMNVFDLQEWRNHNLTTVYHNWLEWGMNTESLPLDLVMFYNLTMAIYGKWRIVRLGDDPNAGHEEIEKATAIHYAGRKKPWLVFGIDDYKQYWKKFVKYDHPYMQDCNIRY